MLNGLIVNSRGDKQWLLNGRPHRVDGPALEFAGGEKHWYQNGKLHRLDGPACEFTNGNKYWWINDEKINCKTNEEFLRIVKLKAFW